MESDECEPFTPPPRTLRSRIESRLRKRQREEKITKPKSKECKNKVEKVSIDFISLLNNYLFHVNIFNKLLNIIHLFIQ